MPSMIHKLLLQPVPKPEQQGRIIRFGNEEPDIQLVTGAMPERILAYLKRNDCPVTAKEIATGIGTNNSRVTRVLQPLLKERKVQCIKIDGCVTEYELFRNSC